jgi:TatD DNase family protein
MFTIPDVHTHEKSFAKNRVVSLSAEFIESKSEPQGPFTVGVHPWWIQKCENLWPKVLELSTHPLCVAIGETGLDRLHPNFEEQRIGVKKHRELALKMKKPLIFHQVKSQQDFIQLCEGKPFLGTCLWHDFHGHDLVLNEFVKFYPQSFFSLSPKAADRTILSVPLERLVLETDEKSDEELNLLFHKVCELKQISSDVLLNHLKKQYLQLFSIQL